MNPEVWKGDAGLHCPSTSDFALQVLGTSDNSLGTRSRELTARFTGHDHTLLDSYDGH